MCLRDRFRTLRSSHHYSNWTSWANDLGFPIEERIAMGQELSHWVDHQRHALISNLAITFLDFLIKGKPVLKTGTSATDRTSAA